MSAEKRSITKCHYRYSQINNFVSVKDFMFVREDGINRLLIRFCNYSNHTIDALTFTVTELDASGKALGEFTICEEFFEMHPGSTYAPEAGFKVHSDCCDCRITVRRAQSGNYIYRTQGKSIITDYSKPREKIIENVSGGKSPQLFYVTSEQSKKARASAFLAFICLFAILAVNAARPFALYYKNEITQFVKEYAESLRQEETTEAETEEPLK